jgi:hypothetical protein
MTSTISVQHNRLMISDGVCFMNIHKMNMHTIYAYVTMWVTETQSFFPIWPSVLNILKEFYIYNVVMN